MTVGDAHRRFVGQTVVVDTATPVIYLGTLVEADEVFLTLEDVDVRDISDSQATKAIVIMEARRNGVAAERKRTHVRQDAVLSISLLADVHLF
jgi:small nuclear ribonucleoprotein (snRNP)-like protein